MRTPAGDAWILSADEAACRAARGISAAVDPRVWPGGLLLAGEIAGTWRRAGNVLTVRPWPRLSAAERDAVVAEAETLPLPGRVLVRWDD